MRTIIFSVDPNINCVCSAVSAILNTIQTMFSLNENNLFELKVILNELIINAISHGNNYDCGKKTFVALRKINNKYIYISVTDEGRGFDYQNNIRTIFCKDYINDECREHGRGLIIVSSLCDKIKFNHIGNKISILKNLI